MWEDMEKTRQFGFGDEVKRRIMLGTYALSAGYYDAYYLKAQKVRTLIRREFDAAFEKHDVLVAPVSPTPAFKIGEKTGDPLQMYLSDVCTLPVNIAGLPGISVPCGFATGGRRRPPPDRPPDHRQAVRRGDALPGRPRLRAVDGMAPGASGAVTDLRQPSRKLGRRDHLAVGLILILFIVLTPLTLLAFWLLDTPGVLWILFVASDIALIGTTAYFYCRVKSQSLT